MFHGQGNLMPHCSDSQCTAGVISGKEFSCCNGLDSEKSEQLLNIYFSMYLLLESVNLVQREHLGGTHESENLGIEDSLLCLSTKSHYVSC